MKNSKFLISVNKLSAFEEYKKIGFTNFLFAVKGFSAGLPAFALEELKGLDGNIYLNINRIMDSATIEALKKLSKELDFVKGIFFDDLGVYQILKDTEIPLIWNQSHFVLNTKAVNFWLDRTWSACLSNELTLGEIKTILRDCTKPIVLNVFGLNPAMYSRRYLLSCFNQVKSLKMHQKAILEVDEQNKFLAFEDESGTTLYYHQFFNYLPALNELPDEKVLFYYINTLNLSTEAVVNLTNGLMPESKEKFLNQKTIYKLEGPNG